MVKFLQKLLRRRQDVVLEGWLSDEVISDLKLSKCCGKSPKVKVGFDDADTYKLVRIECKECGQHIEVGLWGRRKCLFKLLQDLRVDWLESCLRFKSTSKF